MTTHELAKQLMASPNVPVIINGWGSDEGALFEVLAVAKTDSISFHGVNDTAKTERDDLGYNLRRPCVQLLHGNRTPPSKGEIKERKQRIRQYERDKKRLTKDAFQLKYAEIQPLTPAMFEEWGKQC